MSEIDIDRMPRMRDYLEPRDLNTEACLTLAQVVLSEQAKELTEAARRAAEHPNKENLHHLRVCQDFYRSELFAALSCGVVDGEVAMKQIVKDALRGRKVKAI